MGNFSQFYGFRSKFVYYEDLKNTHKDIYDSLKEEGLESSNFHSQKMLNIANTMMKWASTEAKKEVQLLKEYFGVSSLQIPEQELYTQRFGKDLIDAINTSLSFKEVYERHLRRIAGGQAKITGAAVFASMFSDTLGELIRDKYNKIIKQVPNISFKELKEELFSDSIISEALYKTIFVKLRDSGDWQKGDTQGYQRLLSKINEYDDTANKMLKQIGDLYGLDTLKERILQVIKSKKKVESLINSPRGKTALQTEIQGALGETNYAKGTLAEIFGENSLRIVLNEISKSVPQARQIQLSRSGGYRNKPDISASFGLDFEKITSTVEEYYENRTEVVKANKQLNNYLSKVKNGFVVYTNVKEYTLTENFSGFHTGSDMKLKSFEGVISNTPGGSRDLIGQIMSTMKGAILEDRKKELEEEICQRMAYFLFDDVLTIGKDTAAGSHVIHLMLLDGVYIPLSYLFFLMARAIREAERDLRDIFSVTIYPGTIKYPNGPWEPGAWRDQKEDAYENIKIGAKFLKNFTDMIREVKGT